MGIDVMFFRPETVGKLKKDSNLSFKDEKIAYKDSKLGLYGDYEDDKYLTIGRWIRSDFFPLVEYLWKTYGIMCFDDCNFDDQEFYHILNGLLDDRGITEDEQFAYAEYFCAKAMLTYFNDEKLEDIIKKNQDKYDKVMKALNEYFEDGKKEDEKNEERMEKVVRTVNDEDLPF